MQSNTPIIASIDHYLTPPDPHVAQKIGGFPLFTFIVALVTLLIESWATYALVQGQIGLATALLIHFVLCGLLVLAFVLFTPLATNHLFMGLLVVTVIPTGPIGAAGVAVACLLWLWFSLWSAPFSEWFKTIFPSPIITRPEAVDEDLRTGRDESAKSYDVESFMDVLRFGTDDQKRRALSKITSFFSPGFAPALRLALGDESNMIRVQAATASSMIENRFQKRLIDLERIYNQHRKNDPQVVRALADFLDDYAFTGILDDAREASNRKRAKALYEEYLAEMPRDGVTHTRYGRLLLRMGELQPAIREFEQALVEQMTPTRAAWLAEAYFRNGEYEKLRALATRLHYEHAGMLALMEQSIRDSLLSWIGLAHTKEAV